MECSYGDLQISHELKYIGIYDHQIPNMTLLLRQIFKILGLFLYAGACNIEY